MDLTVSSTHLVYDLLDCSRDDAASDFVLGVERIRPHCVGLSASCLAVSEDADVVTVEKRCD